ncbi:MAG: hypothetical protein KDJ75_00270 [Alphaproteobacteria bacterium]|nr:hypothetical protein [Alphaproteobacteria bacterium]
MIIQNGLPPPHAVATSGQEGLQPGGAFFKMVENPRTAGLIPVWDSRPQPVTALPLADDAGNAHGAWANGLQIGIDDNAKAPEPFGFGDFIDMINPLQHIPLINHIYRELTGDRIKPISQIIGGALFGGPIGAAGGLANAVVEAETGRDLTENVVDMLTKSPHKQARDAGKRGEESAAGAMLAFSDLRRP